MAERTPPALDGVPRGVLQTRIMNVKTLLAVVTGLLIIGISVSLFVAGNVQFANPIPINDLAQLVKEGRVAAIEVNGDNALAVTSDQQTFAVHLDDPGGLPRLLESFGVVPAELGQVRYSVSSGPKRCR